MHVTTLFTLLAACTAFPLPQLAGEGSACDSLLSSTDNGVGYGVENAEDNTAAAISSSSLLRLLLHKKQLAGEGSACDSLLSDTDNGVGYGVENAEDNTAGTITSAETTPAPAVPAPGTKGRRRRRWWWVARRQLDKIADGAAAVSDAVGTGQLTGPATTGADGVDGTSTSAAAELGAEVGGTEEGTLEAAGKAAP